MTVKLFRVVVIVFTYATITFCVACSKSGDNNSSTVNPPPPPPPPPVTKVWQVSTVAGNGADGVLDGPDSTASFKFPIYLCLDASGNIFVGDMYNNFIRKISGHQVSTYIGKNTPGIDPIFMGIQGLVADNQNNLYDIESGFIRQVSSATTASIFVGSTEHTIKDGQGISARFNEINGLVLGSDNNFYLTDLDFNSKTIIRKVSMAGLVSTLVLQDNTGIVSGSTNGVYVSYQPMVIDKNGIIYFTANRNSLIKKVDVNGNVSVFAGSVQVGTADGKSTAAQFNFITSMTITNDGTIFLTDQLSNNVRKVSTDGTVTTIAGNTIPGYTDGEGSVARFNSPFGITIDGNGMLYIADAGNHRIRKMELK